jgi:hypothetical protein
MENTCIVASFNKEVRVGTVNKRREDRRGNHKVQDYLQEHNMIFCDIEICICIILVLYKRADDLNLYVYVRWYKRSSEDIIWEGWHLHMENTCIVASFNKEVRVGTVNKRREDRRGNHKVYFKRPL